MWLWLWLVRRRARVSELPGLVCFVLWLFDLVLATALVMRRELLLEGFPRPSRQYFWALLAEILVTRGLPGLLLGSLGILHRHRRRPSFLPIINCCAGTK
jgi:hypothetical protein